MPVLSPPPFVQGGSHTSKQVRQFVSAIQGQPVETFVNSVGAVGPAHGLVSPGDLAVVQNGTPNMSVNVGAGRAFISGNSSLVQGAYVFTNDATTNVVIATADGSNPRRDLVCAQVRETIEDSSGQNSARLFIVTGTPAASPVDPAIPAGCLVLARVTVAALATSVVNANITTVARSAGDESWVLTTLGQPGPVACTTTYGYRRRLGGSAWVAQIALAITATGAAGNAIAVATPYPLTNAEAIGGSFTYFDSGNTIYTGTVWPATSTGFLLQVSGNGAQLGSAPSFAIANGDALRLTIHGS